MAPRITTQTEEAALKAGLSAAFNHTDESGTELSETGFGLQFTPFGTNHDITRIAQLDPIMALTAQNPETGFSMQIPASRAVLPAQTTAPDASAVSLGAGLPSGENRKITISAGHASKTGSLPSTRLHGACAGMNAGNPLRTGQTDTGPTCKIMLNRSAKASR